MLLQCNYCVITVLAASKIPTLSSPRWDCGLQKLAFWWRPVSSTTTLVGAWLCHALEWKELEMECLSLFLFFQPPHPLLLLHFSVGYDKYTHGCLPVRPNWACPLSAVSVWDSVWRWLGNLGNLSHAVLLVATPPPTHGRSTLFTQWHGGRTPFAHAEERQPRWDPGKESSPGRHAGRRGLACEDAAIFGAAEGGEHLMVFYIAGMLFVSARFKSDSCCIKLKKQVASFGRHLRRWGDTSSSLENWTERSGLNPVQDAP